MTNKYIKRNSILLISGEIQTKTAVRHYFVPVRMTTNQKEEITSVGKNIEKKESLCTIGGIAHLRSHVKNYMDVPAIPLLGIYLKKTITLI